MSARRARSAAYTVIEVVMALGILAVGAAGIIAIQKATLINNTNARNLAVANAIAASWAERLRTDAVMWNVPQGNDDLTGDTDYLKLTTLSPYPAKIVPPALLDFGTPNADVLGADMGGSDTAATAFCTHLRFRRFTSQVSGNAIWDKLIRVDIRVFWERNGTPVTCDSAIAATVDTESHRYGAVYLTTSVFQNETD